MVQNSEDIKLKIPKGCHGHDLQELMYKFVNWFALANERRDKYTKEVEDQKLHIDFIEAQAIKMIEEKCLNENIKMTSDVKRAHVFNKEVILNAVPTSVYEEKKKLLEKKYKLSQIESKVKELERLISVCQSSLSFDRQEAIMQRQ